MTDTLMRLDIAACPACGNAHTYRVVVRRDEASTGSVDAKRGTRLLICPNKNAEFAATLELAGVEVHSATREADELPLEPAGPSPAVRLLSVAALTQHDKALGQAGTKMLVDSVEVGREFCKFMTTTSIAAVGTYLALLALVTPKDYRLQSSGELLLLAPSFLFLGAAIAFVTGYLPQRTGHADVDCPTEVSCARAAVVERRLRMSILGFVLFSAAVVAGTFIVIGRLPG